MPGYKTPSVMDILSSMQQQQQNNGSGGLFGKPQMQDQGLFGSQGFGLNQGTFNTLGQGLQGLQGLASIYFGNKQLNLAEDQYNTNKDFGNRNIANQATTINNSLEARYRAALAAKGHGIEGGGNKESLESYLTRSKVDGSAIG